MKKPVDYLYLKCEPGKKRGISVKAGYAAGIRMLEVCISEKKLERIEKRMRSRPFEKWKKDFVRALHSYDVSDCAINGDHIILQVIGAENVGFFARKEELLSQGRYILEQLRQASAAGRKKLLIFLESGGWKLQELYALLLFAKDYYEDITLAVEEESIGDSLAASLFEECGIVITVSDLNNVVKEGYNSVIFLVAEWNPRYSRILSFQSAYVLAEQEGGGLERRTGAGKAQGMSVCFSGLSYMCNGKKLPYQPVVDLYYQNRTFYDKIGISSVAICRLECYNKEEQAAQV